MRKKMNSKCACLWLALIYLGLPTSSGRTVFDKTVDFLVRPVRQSESEDMIVFEAEEEPLKNYEPNEILCLAQKKILVSGKCYDLSKTGPCGEGEWLVLDNSIQGEEKLTAICKKKPCADTTSKVWWPALSECIPKTEAKSKYCAGSDKTIQLNGFGEAICTCHDSSGTLEGGDKCYEFYQQGPCRRNEVVTYDIMTGNAVCSFDKCYQENRKSVSKRSLITERDLHHVGRYQDTNKSSFRNMDEGELSDSIAQIDEKRFKRAAEQKRKAYAPFGGDGACYKLSSSSICEEQGAQSRYIIDVISHVPKCSMGNFKLQLISPASLCNVDHTNKCAQSISLDNRRSAISQAISLMKQAKGRKK